MVLFKLCSCGYKKKQAKWYYTVLPMLYSTTNITHTHTHTHHYQYHRSTTNVTHRQYYQCHTQTVLPIITHRQYYQCHTHTVLPVSHTDSTTNITQKYYQCHTQTVLPVSHTHSTTSVTHRQYYQWHTNRQYYQCHTQTVLPMAYKQTVGYYKCHLYPDSSPFDATDLVSTNQHRTFQNRVTDKPMECHWNIFKVLCKQNSAVRLYLNVPLVVIKSSSSQLTHR